MKIFQKYKAEYFALAGAVALCVFWVVLGLFLILVVEPSERARWYENTSDIYIAQGAAYNDQAYEALEAALRLDPSDSRRWLKMAYLSAVVPDHAGQADLALDIARRLDPALSPIVEHYRETIKETPNHESDSNETIIE